MSEPPRRFKELEEMTSEEMFTYSQTQVLPETDDYREYKRKTLLRAGLEDEAAEQEASVDVNEMSVEQHFNRIRERR